MKSLLFGIHAADPWTIAATVIAFAAFVVLSTWLPAANAARTNLLASLHEE